MFDELVHVLDLVRGSHGIFILMGNCILVIIVTMFKYVVLCAAAATEESILIGWSM